MKNAEQLRAWLDGKRVQSVARDDRPSNYCCLLPDASDPSAASYIHRFSDSYDVKVITAPVKLKYRVGVIVFGLRRMTVTADDAQAAIEIERDEHFKYWATDWQEIEVSE